jgi:hypothetical protein
MAKKIETPRAQVFKFDYTMRSNREVNWVASVAGYTKEECEKYLRKSIKDDLNITGVEKVFRLDAISDELRKTIYDNTKYPKKRVGRPVGDGGKEVEPKKKIKLKK